jgi:Flp pilus assembly protein TadG
MPMMKRVNFLASRIFKSRRWSTSAGAFLKDRRGATAIEFAMISVPFLGLIGAVFETGSVYFKNSQLQLTTETASRAVLTHNADPNMTPQQFIDDSVCTWKSSGTVKSGTLSTMFNCDLIKVDIRPCVDWSSCSTANDFSTSTIALPAAGQIAIVRISYPMSALNAILTGGVFSGQTISQSRAGQVQVNGAWTYKLLGVFAFRVEP